MIAPENTYTADAGSGFHGATEKIITGDIRSILGSRYPTQWLSADLMPSDLRMRSGSQADGRRALHRRGISPGRYFAGAGDLAYNALLPWIAARRTSNLEFWRSLARFSFCIRVA